jgi:integrase/recombinase XerD
MRFYGMLQQTKGNFNQSISLDDAFEQFQNFNVAKNLAPCTINHYKSCFDLFTDFYGKREICYSVNENVVFSYIAHLKSKNNISDITLNTYLRTLRVFLYYCMEHGYMEPFSIKLIKTTKPIKKTYTDYELAILLEKPQINKVTFCEYRNWVLVNYVLATANRESTMSNLKICDIDFENDMIHLRKTKNRREQIIPLSSSLRKVLKEYLKYRKGESEDYLFCNVTGDRLTENAQISDR